ncbi:MAG: hypothetical protein HZB37_04405 [Planctomycetes bacterium]|nr:hypothetical protein [Planctomycetota bacterium]MBI5740563.1 hypothetical protein [Nitrospirota bacterium]
MNPPNASSGCKPGTRHEPAKPATKGMMTKGPYMGQLGHKGDISQSRHKYAKYATNGLTKDSKGSWECKHKPDKHDTKGAIKGTMGTP